MGTPSQMTCVLSLESTWWESKPDSCKLSFELHRCAVAHVCPGPIKTSNFFLKDKTVSEEHHHLFTSGLNTCTQCTHIHAHSYTHIHAYIHIHTHACRHMHACTHPCLCMHTHTYMHRETEHLAYCLVVLGCKKKSRKHELFGGGSPRLLLVS